MHLITNTEVFSYREEGVDDVGLYGAERFVSDHDEDLLLLLQVDEVPKPRLLSQSARKKGKDAPILHPRLDARRDMHNLFNRLLVYETASH